LYTKEADLPFAFFFVFECTFFLFGFAGKKLTSRVGIISKQTMTSADQYKRLSLRDHILELPDTYIGSVETHEDACWIYDSEKQKMIHRKTAFNPGFYKIFDEIIVNARDALVRSQTDTANRQPIKSITVTAGKTTEGVFEISVENDGDGIPVEMHPTEKVYAPELIFGHLLTSENYNKGEEKIVGGKNGYGAKLANKMVSDIPRRGLTICLPAANPAFALTRLPRDLCVSPFSLISVALLDSISMKWSR
jgi:hypothetical protein